MKTKKFTKNNNVRLFQRWLVSAIIPFYIAIIIRNFSEGREGLINEIVWATQESWTTHTHTNKNIAHSVKNNKEVKSQIVTVRHVQCRFFSLSFASYFRSLFYASFFHFIYSFRTFIFKQHQHWKLLHSY